MTMREAIAFHFSEMFVFLNHSSILVSETFIPTSSEPKIKEYCRWRNAASSFNQLSEIEQNGMGAITVRAFTSALAFSYAKETEEDGVERMGISC